MEEPEPLKYDIFTRSPEYLVAVDAGPDVQSQALRDFLATQDPELDMPDRSRTLFCLFSNYSRYQRPDKALETLRLLEAIGDSSEPWPGAIASCLFWDLNDMHETERHVHGFFHGVARDYDGTNYPNNSAQLSTSRSLSLN
jgi:hypothetical protein